MSLANTLQTFRDAVTSVNGLIASAHKVDATGARLWTLDETKFITESAFLKMFIAWESFLEGSFILYLTGNASIAGTILTKYANPIDEDHAHKILIGVMKYVDWSKPDVVRRFAKLYFDSGEPYETVLSSTQSDLVDLSIIRNSSAHISHTTSNKLDALATRKLGHPVTGATVYDLILATDPLHPGATILGNYQSILDAAAYLIATT